MMSARTLRIWAWLHKWASLVCTVFMLVLCLTGLPLIFHHEIGEWLGTEVDAPSMPANAPRVSLDRVMQVAKERFPNKNGMFVSQEPDDDKVWFVTMSDTPTSESATSSRSRSTHAAASRSPNRNSTPGVMFVDAHKAARRTFRGPLPGKLFLGFMGDADAGRRSCRVSCCMRRS